MKIHHWLYDYINSFGVAETAAVYLNMLFLLIVTLIITYILDYLTRNILMVAFVRYAKKSKTQFDDFLVSNKLPRYVAHILPLFAIIELIPIVFYDFPRLEKFAELGLKLFGIVLTLWIVRSFLNTLRDYFKTLPKAKNKPIDSYIQVFMIVAWVGGFMLAFAIVSGTTIWKFFTVLGAASAVIILVFKDTIMGFVASIQVSVNDMVRIGDWITFEKYGADGDVTEINLSTVKVQNFDKTITTIPTYALISDSFKNWRGMVDSSGRRIKRSLGIQKGSIKFLTAEDVQKLLEIELIKDYLLNRQADIEKFNETHEIDKKVAINGRNLTNIGVFRKYIDAYLKHHSAVNKNMTMMVRQLEPGPYGIPLEIYAFSSDKKWENYEYIVADIFDHLLAAVPFFDLKLYEMPNSESFNGI